ncbi:right-handed parallel beta-helix repeat-containing protein [Amycolatopsis sp. FU40]|uniref:right-handed parallel beta-helix repeat-containing protein n=1 Tax=Amycolatopsis sp. FU40 TaxID=2914159 RepID=UPI001F3BFF82|nr:NosD domain-containing protein [Amycolatopsis sp. FU40]UKD58324.1 right-handed parallel beta-helix repeat-containing protein [Amycolatopsis sp. FU40]
MRFPAMVAILGLSAALAGGCGSSSAEGRRPDGTGVTIRVPADAPTISAAVSLARAGDLVLVAPGEYHETVKITTPRVTLRGEVREKVVVDGQLKRDNGVVVSAPGVAVENLTVRNHTQNGVLVTGSVKAADGLPGHGGGYDTGDEPIRFLSAFLVSHVTATRNGLYGIYAFSAQNGVIEQSYASGGADSGIYVGQCQPCRTVVRGNVAELNAVGFEGTNASGEMYVVGNRFSGNRVGATANSDHQEKLLPQQNSVLAGNLVAANGQAATPEQADGGWGIGIGIDGGSGNQVLRNRIAGNPNAGLVLTATQDVPPKDNRIAGDVFAANGIDVGWTFPGATKGSGNCLDSGALHTIPEGLPTNAACPATAASPSGMWTRAKPPAGIPFTEVAAPPSQPQFPDARTAGPTVVPAVPEFPDVAQIQAPAASLLADRASVTAA